MGKYTSLALKYKKPEPQKKCVYKGLYNTYKHSIVVDTGSNPVSPSSEGVTNLRTTNLTNLIEVTCIHGTTEDRCAVCSGYARWLALDESRLRLARSKPEEVRGEFWRMVRGGR